MSKIEHPFAFSRSMKRTSRKLMDCQGDGSVLDIVNPAQIQQLLNSALIGEKIRQLRLSRSMGLVELGSCVGLSASFLSQLEAGQIHPTLRNLARLSLIFEKDLSYFFHHTSSSSLFRISHGRDRIPLSLGLKNVPLVITDNISAVVFDNRIAPYITTLVPSAHGAALEPPPFKGREFAYILSGSIRLSTKRRTELLESHDAVWVDGGVTRRYVCVGTNTARVFVLSVSNCT